MIVVLFCKQKTAYELLISDWSSDVCSSDLIASGEQKKRLADAEWIPDVSLGVRAVEEDGRPRAYEGIVSFNIPLRWGLREARQDEATAETSRKSVVRGKGVSVRVDLGGTRQVEKKKKLNRATKQRRR